MSTSDTPIHLSDIGILPPIVQDYLAGKLRVETIVQASHTPDSYINSVQTRMLSTEQRTVLVDVLKEQYRDSFIDLSNSERVFTNIQSLTQPNVFTVTTGHQLCLYGGPLYFIYKIITTIRLAEEVEAKTGKKIVPVFWLASEDHDFEEIQSVYIFGKKLVWNKDSKQQAVGQLTTEEIAELNQQLIALAGNRIRANEWFTLFQQAYESGLNLAQATRNWVHTLFASYGLVVLDAADTRLKTFLKPVIKSDILEQQTFSNLAPLENKLETEYGKTQVHVREINFFYLDKKWGRRRIQKLNNQFHLVDTDIYFSEQELAEEMEQNPERFSPNVMIRPMYQELILPNLAYIGGPAEIAYWLQLKPAFDALSIYFPILVLRNSLVITGSGLDEKLKKAGLAFSDLFIGKEKIAQKLIQANLKSAPEQVAEEIQQLLQSLVDMAKDSDAELMRQLLNTKKELKNTLNQQMRQLKKSLELKHQSEIDKALKLRERIFPNDVFQERIENIVQYDASQEESILPRIHQHIDPFDYTLKRITI